MMPSYSASLFALGNANLRVYLNFYHFEEINISLAPILFYVENPFALAIHQSGLATKALCMNLHLAKKSLNGRFSI